MIEIQVKPGESIESVLRRFQALCNKEGITKDMKRSLYFDKKAKRKGNHRRKPSQFRRIEIDDESKG